MVASLYGVGVTALETGSGVASLSNLNTADAKTRIITNSPYLNRVNMFEVSRSNAPTPADQPGAGGNPSLADWNNYVQWDNSIDGRGYNTYLTAKSSDGVTFNWSKPPDYDQFNAGSVRQSVFVKTCTGTTFPTDCEGENPFAGVNSGSNDGTSLSVTGLQPETWYIGAVRMQWNDNGTGTPTYDHSGLGYGIAASPGEGGYDDTAGNDGAIIFQTTAAAVCNNPSVGVSTDVTDPDGGCDACADYSSSPDTGKYFDGSVTVNGTIMYTENTCTTQEGGTIRWVAGNADEARLSTGGVLQTTTVNCQTECLACLHYDMMVRVLRD